MDREVNKLIQIGTSCLGYVEEDDSGYEYNLLIKPATYFGGWYTHVSKASFIVSAIIEGWELVFRKEKKVYCLKKIMNNGKEKFLNLGKTEYGYAKYLIDNNLVTENFVDEFLKTNPPRKTNKEIHDEEIELLRKTW